MVKLNQIRAARGLLGWHQKDLARIAGISELSVINIENGKTSPQQSTLDKIVKAFEKSGIEFTDGGVRPKQSRVYRFIGHEEFLKFSDEVYETARTSKNADICVANVREEDFLKWRRERGLAHRARMEALGNVRIRVIVEEGDKNEQAAPYADYRWIARDKFAQVPLYLYGDKTAFIELSEHNVIVTVTDSPAITKAMRKMFEMAWGMASEKPL